MDPISAMRLSGLGAMGNLPSIQAPQIATEELKGLGSISAPKPDGIQAGRSFSDFLGQMVQDVNAKQAAAGNAVEGVLAGENVPLHQAMLAIEEAGVSFQLMVEVRNKLLESYQELMRMQI
jgi:flagellar hook-basal body complex protein FliE